MTDLRWTSADLEALPYAEGMRYEIIDGELYVSKQPTWAHQLVTTTLAVALAQWSRQRHAGGTAVAPGLIFSDDNDVAPDLVWVSSERLPELLGPEGHLHGAPDLVVEALSPGRANEQRDRERKRELYSRRGVREYWIVDPRRREIEIYRRADAALAVAATLLDGDTLTSPMLPGFALPLAELFADLPSI